MAKTAQYGQVFSRKRDLMERGALRATPWLGRPCRISGLRYAANLAKVARRDGFEETLADSH